MGWLATIGNLFKPATDLIDSLNAPKEARTELKAMIAGLQANITLKGLELEKTAMVIGGDAVKAEAGGESWIQKSWRPLMMIWFGLLLGCYWFGLTPQNLTEKIALELLVIIKIALGGYVFGRSLEKSVKNYVNGKVGKE